MTIGTDAACGRAGVGSAAALFGVLSLLACSASGGACSGEPCSSDGALQLATWWGSRGELSAAFDILEQSYRSETGRDVHFPHSFPTKDDHIGWVEDQLEGVVEPLPFDVFSANNGDEILHWTDCAASGNPPPGPKGRGPKLRGLTDPALGPLAPDRKWIADTFEPKVMETVQCHGETYAIPVGIHRINTLFYNKALFREAGYAVDGLAAGDGAASRPLPSTLTELHEAIQRIGEHLPAPDPYEALPPSVFAVAGREAWTVSLFFIENLMLALAADPEEYQRYWRGEACNEPLLERTLREIEALRPHFGSWDLNVSEALQRVRNGRAAMLVTGDWARAEFNPADVGSMPFPGTSQYFVFSADVFALPAIETADVDNGLAWLHSVTLAQTQSAFAIAKHAWPARIDIAAELSPPMEASLTDAPPTWVRSLPALLPYRVEGPFRGLQDELARGLDQGDIVERLLRYARQEYPKLSSGRARCPESALDDPSVEGGLDPISQIE